MYVKDRNISIDGIRGWAALSVLLFHIYWECLSYIRPDIKSPILKLLFNGPLAVSVFFVLSGQALSSNYFKLCDPRSLDITVLKRYFRLAVPIFFSSMLVYFFMVFGWVKNEEAGKLLGSEWLSGFLNFSPSFFGVLKYSFSDVFFNHSSSNSYNPFLWPMAIEMLGSLCVFCYLYAYEAFVYPRVVLAIICLGGFFINPFLSLFFLGVAISRHEEFFISLRNNVNISRVSMFLLFAVCVSVVLVFSTSSVGSGGGSGVIKGNRNDHAYAILAIVLVFLINLNKHCIDFFSNPISVFLGRISFPLYLTHFSVMVSVFSMIVVSYENRLDLIQDSILLGAGVGGICCVVAYLFMHLELYLMKILNGFLKRCVKQRGGRA